MRKWQLRIVLSVALSVLSLSSVWAWPSQLYGIKEEEAFVSELQPQSETDTKIQVPLKMPQEQPAEVLKSATESLGMQLEDTLSQKDFEELRTAISAMEVAQQSMEDEYYELVEERNTLADENTCLVQKISELDDETGTKAYLLLDGIVGFSDGYPSYGLGLTVGTRLGNNLMLELGTDYMFGANLSELIDSSIDDWTFRAGIGWMF